MGEVHTYREVIVNREKQYDPTRTVTLRNRFTRAVKGRFRELQRLIYMAIVEQDVFGLQVEQYQMTLPGKHQFNFPRSGDKTAAFMDWLREQQERGILEVRHIPQLGGAIEGQWTNQYISDSYKRGVIRARYEMNRAGVMNVPSLEATGGIEASMSSPFHVDRLGILYTRVFEELKGITHAMDQQISRVLAQGIADGDNPRLLARKLIATIDGTGIGELGITDTLGRFIPAQRRAEMMARTEIIRAHHQATIQEYRNWGLEGVQVRAEFRTAGDDRVCEQCASLHRREFSLQEIEYIIPVHPHCRCIALPVTNTKKRKNENT